ncbi:hypothetical protein H0H81_009429 [Sphagnurus paluster]|uniref:Vps72/YL1 C-terminal domain-containing protein n=1 Tax=Sphagnurus paluster TaxID=117069 RepID=A0A9P7FPE9_9AGAR|nr:hypothetical protein H0H81_009429 [Sphagnurus paluster]
MASADQQDTDGDTEMVEPVEFLVTRRSRRSTAGNRMEAALAEMALDTAMDAIEDDQDFVNDKDEEDVFGSDFESTDEEAAQEEVEAGDRAVLDEERRARKDARTRVERATAAAHTKHRVTFNPDASTAASASTSTPKPKPKNKDGVERRRVSLGGAVNAETGEVLREHMDALTPSPKKKRHSQRRHTILNTSETATRIRHSEAKKAATPKKHKSESRTYTQAELIARALDNEEGNIVEHRDYLKVEEEKRRRARVVRPAVEGPRLRWVSRAEEVRVRVVVPSAPAVGVGGAGAGTGAGGTAQFQTRNAPMYGYGYGYATGTAAAGLVYGQTPFTYSAGVYPHMAYGSAGGSMGAGTSTPARTGAAATTTPVGTSATATAMPVGTSATATAKPAGTTPASTSATATVSAGTTTATTTTSMPVINPASGISQTPTPAPTQTQSQTTPYQRAMYNPYLAHLQLQQQQQQQQSSSSSTPSTSTSATATTTNPATPAIPTPLYLYPPPVQAPTEIERTETVTKNYLVHELGQEKGTPRPQWGDTMAALFGDHVVWDDVKVFVGRGRPLSRPRQTCPITGRQARYRDPRTGVPYADAHAYRVLTRLLNHEFAWSPALGCYVGVDESRVPGQAGSGAVAVAGVVTGV